MPDAEQEYPFHQPQRRTGNGRHSPHDDQTEPIKGARRDRQGPIYLDEEVLTSPLPRGPYEPAFRCPLRRHHRRRPRLHTHRPPTRRR